MKKNSTLPLQHNESADLVPLTDKLYTEFSIEVLEERLETDPLMLTGLFNEVTPFCVQCKKDSDFRCQPTYCTGCYGDGNCTCNGGHDTCTCNTVDADVECFKA